MFKSLSAHIRSIGSEQASVVPAPGAVVLTGAGESPAYFPVSDFAQSSIATAVSEVQSLRQFLWGTDGEAEVNRLLACLWCERSAYPLDWKLPARWDEYAGDYRTLDGWIRLHTNAARHRTAALKVLGNPDSRNSAAVRINQWLGQELEDAVVNAGGAAACMMSSEQWATHPQGKSINAEPVVLWQEKAPTGGSASYGANSDQLSPSEQLSGEYLLASATAARPLQGVRVLDLTRVLAGPVCTRFLSSLGADVLRIDPPGWNEDVNVPEMTVGKRCAGLDLRKSEDKAVFEALFKQAHVVVHGYRREALAGLGFDADTRARLNPRAIDVALNAYGWSGPWSGRRGFDSLVQMSSGIAEFGMRSAQSDKPVSLPFQALDHVTGYLMAATVVHAIVQLVSSERVCSARLSLARQAKLLQDMSDQLTRGLAFYESTVSNRFEEIADRHFADGLEQSPCGVLRRLKLPYKIAGVDTRFGKPVNQLRSQEAKWI